MVIFDGLTKNWRYPGWRVTWTVGPKQVIEAVASAGSFLDGGGSKPLQRAAIPLLEDAHVVAETRPSTPPSARSATSCSRGWSGWGSRIDRAPEGTFYVWGNVAGLPPPLDDGMGFFRAALEQAGDLRAGRVLRREPGQAPRQRASRFRRYVRLSFGPAMDNLETALARLETLIAALTPSRAPRGRLRRRCSAAASSPCRSGPGRRSRV